MAKRIERKFPNLIMKSFKVGDILRVSSDEELIQRKQVDCGGYSRIRMGDLKGSLVSVKHFGPKCVKVERIGPGFEERYYDLHIDILDYPKDDSKSGKPGDSMGQNYELFEAISRNDMEKFFELMDTDTLNLQNGEGKTPLNFACCLGKNEIVDCLLGFEADINIPDYQGYLPIHNCVLNDHIDIFKLLLERNPNHFHRRSENGQILMSIVHQKKNKDLEIFLLNFNENSSERISRSHEMSLPISLLDPQITLSVPNESSVTPVTRYSSNLTSSLMSAPKNENIRNYQQILQEYETIEVPSMTQSLQQISLNTIPAENECTICRDELMNIAFVPCGHLACRRCSDRIFKCHICNSEIESKITIYL